jgi:hypothetical protein
MFYFSRLKASNYFELKVKTEKECPFSIVNNYAIMIFKIKIFENQQIERLKNRPGFR